MTTPLRRQLEALLFSSGKHMTPAQLTELIGQDEQAIARELVELQRELDERDTSLRLFEENGAWKMNVREAYLPLVQSIVAETELPGPIMETLAVIAYAKKPMQSEVVNTRGSHAYEHIAELAKLGYIARERDGRTYRLKLSEKFFRYFELNSQQDVDAFFRDVERPEPKMPTPEVRPEPHQLQLDQVRFSDEEREAHSVFLTDMEERLAQARERNDALEQDATFREYAEQRRQAELSAQDTHEQGEVDEHNPEIADAARQQDAPEAPEERLDAEATDEQAGDDARPAPTTSVHVAGGEDEGDEDGAHHVPDQTPEGDPWDKDP